MSEIGEVPKHFYQLTKLILCKDANSLIYKSGHMCRIDTRYNEFVRQYCLLSMRLRKCGPRERQLSEIGEVPKKPFSCQKVVGANQTSFSDDQLEVLLELKKQKAFKIHCGRTYKGRGKKG